MPYEDHDYRMRIKLETWKTVNAGHGPCVVGTADDWTWFADVLNTLTVLVPDKKLKHHGIASLTC